MDALKKLFLDIRRFADAAYDFYKRGDNGTGRFKAEHLNHVESFLDGRIDLVDCSDDDMFFLADHLENIPLIMGEDYGTFFGCYGVCAGYATSSA